VTTAERQDYSLVAGPRWSTSATICPRQAVYTALGIEGAPLTEEAERRFARGTRIGRMMGEEVAAVLTARGKHVILEHEAPWPIWHPQPVGTGHADALVCDADGEPEEVIEIVSSREAALPPRKPLQAAGYAIHRGVTRARILAVDPATNEECPYPVNVEGLAAQVREIEEAVVAGIESGGRDLPDRVEQTPQAWPCMECQHAARCWDGWTPPPAGNLPGHEQDFVRLLEIDRELKGIPTRPIKELEAERDLIRDALAPLMAAGEDYIELGVKLRRTEVPGRRSIKVADLENAGFTTSGGFPDEYVSVGKPHNRWTIKELRDDGC
jgi:hypothetical protein